MYSLLNFHKLNTAMKPHLIKKQATSTYPKAPLQSPPSHYSSSRVSNHYQHRSALPIFELFTDGIIKGMSGMVRVILMFSGVIISIVIFIIAFGWFQIDDELAWLLFFVNFFICTIVSVSISSIRNRIENRKLDEALQRLKRGEENE